MDKRCYKCTITKSLSEFGKDKSRGDGLRPLCKICVKDKNLQYRLENPEKKKAIEKSWYDRNRDKKIKYTSDWNKANRDKCRVNKNISNKKRKSKDGRMPSWTNNDLIKPFYKNASELSLSTGTKYSVDHIVPLLNPLVCGLHSHTNMRVIPLLDNIRKGNRTWPDMW